MQIIDISITTLYFICNLTLLSSNPSFEQILLSNMERVIFPPGVFIIKLYTRSFHRKYMITFSTIVSYDKNTKTLSDILVILQFWVTQV